MVKSNQHRIPISCIAQGVAVTIFDWVAVTVAVKRSLATTIGGAGNHDIEREMAADQAKLDGAGGEGGGARTHDTRIKSPLLFRLSYAPCPSV